MAPGTAIPEKRAPARLELVQRFVNSVDRESGEDELSGPAELRGWLAERDLLGADERVTKADLERALDVREGLRELLRAHSGLPVDEQRVAALDRAAGRAGMRVAFGLGAEPTLEPAASGVDGALARMLAVVAAAAEQGTWPRLKACSRDVCQWAFFDRSKNHSGRWCQMDACGNIEKARAFRERRRSAN